MAKRTRSYSRPSVQATSLLAAQIKQARIERRWTAKELAERAGISQPTLSRVEQADPSVAIGIVFNVATIVGVPLFFEEQSRLAPEIRRVSEMIRLLPDRVRRIEDDVDDDF